MPTYTQMKTLTLDVSIVYDLQDAPRRALLRYSKEIEYFVVKWNAVGRELRRKHYKPN